MKKPFKGEIHNWKAISYEGETKVVGMPVGHPEFTNWIVTSVVVKHFEPPRHLKDVRKIEIETENSRYTLVGEGKGELP